MGQRSQMYVRIGLKDGKKYLFPRYYQWNFAERMVSRTRGIIEYLQYWAQYPDFIVTNGETNEKMKRYMDTNFDYRDIVLGHDFIDEYVNYGKGEDFEQYVFAGQDNNDGQVFIDLDIDYDNTDRKGDYKYVIKYAFRTYDSDDWNPMDPEQYMDWDSKDWTCGNWRQSDDLKKYVKLIERNINWIRRNAQLMTSDEMFDFAHHDYVSDMRLEVK